ncbi:2-dehydropantoate 2-reductase [Myxococcota bacterium]|nr:2-dehydropantoate 2-reductase [Myxococcota bacterium]
METIIIGPGGVGLALASCLHASGAGLSFLSRQHPPHSLFATQGIHRSGIFGRVAVPPEALIFHSTWRSITDQSPDYLLICSKADALEEIGRGLQSAWAHFDSEPIVILCQNGWGHYEKMGQWIPAKKIYNARIITGFKRAAANHVEVTVHADAIHIGSLADAPLAPVRPLVEAISAGGIPCRVSSEIEADLIAKLLYNCLLNPLGALAQVPYGTLGEREETRLLMQSIASEIFAVLKATGRETHWPNAEAYLDSFYHELLPATAEHHSSMLQDLAAQRPTEIDSLNGAIVRMGAAKGVPTPVNHALRTLIRAAESGPSTEPR